MSKPNLYVLKINGRERVFSVTQLSREANMPRRSARRRIKRAVREGEVNAAVVRNYNQ